MIITFNCQQLVSTFFAYVNVIDVCSPEVQLLTSCGLMPAPLLLFVASYTVFCLMSLQPMFLSRECQCNIVYMNVWTVNVITLIRLVVVLLVYVGILCGWVC